MADHIPNVIHPVVKTFNEYMPKPIIDEVSGTVTYLGFSHFGTKTSDARWRIERVTVAGTVTIVEYGDNSMEFNSIWDNRASINYSR